MIIVDSDIWINFFKNIENKETKELSYLLRNKIEIGTNSIIVTEILQGKSDDKEYQRIKYILNTFKIYWVDHQDILDAGDIFRACRKGNETMTSKTLQTTDCIIAANCIKNNIELFSGDKHFDIIAEITGKLRIYKGEKN
jgi:predicted nucleic acid-binding protein